VTYTAKPNVISMQENSVPDAEGRDYKAEE